MAFADPNPLRGIVLKVCSVTVFVAMQTCIKLAGSGIPPGQISFYRSAFAILPIIVYLAWRGELRMAMQTDNPLGHLKRGLLGVCAMGTGFYGLVHLPLPDAIAIGYRYVFNRNTLIRNQNDKFFTGFEHKGITRGCDF